MLTAPPLFRSPSAAEVQRHMGLVRQVVARFLRRLPANVLRDDLMAAGVHGLIDALRKNGGDEGASFEGYARIRIRGAILDELRTQDWLPRRVRWALRDAEGETSNADGPSAVVGIDDVSANERATFFVDESAIDAETLLCAEDDRRAIGDAIGMLPEREQHIIRMHYLQGARFKDIGKGLRVSEPRVSQLHSRALLMLEKLLREARVAA